MKAHNDADCHNSPIVVALGHCFGHHWELKAARHPCNLHMAHLLLRFLNLSDLIFTITDQTSDAGL